MDAGQVAAALTLGPEFAGWLESLDALGPPADGMPLPVDAELDALLDHLGVDPADRADIDIALAANSEWRWLQERAYHAVRTDVGDTEGIRQTPALPERLGPQARCFWIVVFLAAVGDIRRWHEQHAVPEDISWATLADLGRHIRLYRGRTGHTGLDTHWWIALHFRGGLFAIGRLQFGPYHLRTGPAGPLFWYEDSTTPGFRRGDPAIALHIPEAGPLEPSACDDAFHTARSIFASHFPEYADAVVTCTSWLMDEQLLQYLDVDSNIVRFQRRFELVPGGRDSDASAFHFVFGRAPSDMDSLTPRTSLEQAIVQHVRNGRHWRMRTGWLRLADQA